MTQNEKDFLNFKDVDVEKIEPIKSSEEDEMIDVMNLADVFIWFDESTGGEPKVQVIKNNE